MYAFPNLKRKSFKPFPQMRFDGDMQVAACFLEAVRVNPEDAWAFVSKVYSAGLDLNELQNLLASSSQIKVSKSFYLSNPRNLQTRSVYVEDPGRNLKRLLHLKMIKEQDRYGRLQWKICGVEQEECVKI